MSNHSTHNKNYILGIAVTLPVKEVFSYNVPDNLISTAKVGCRALVPFRNRKVIGYILGKEVWDGEKGLKDILDVLDPEPLFHHSIVPFFQWMSGYYLYPIGRLIQSALPGGLNVTPFKTGKITRKGLKALNSITTASDER